MPFKDSAIEIQNGPPTKLKLNSTLLIGRSS